MLEDRGRLEVGTLFANDLARCLLAIHRDGAFCLEKADSQRKRGIRWRVVWQVATMVGTILMLGLAMAWAFSLPVTVQVVRSTLRCVTRR